MKLEKMSELEFAVEMAILHFQSLGVMIEMPGFEAPELIINPVKNLEKKLAYYQATYDENLEHKHAKGIKIIGYTFC